MSIKQAIEALEEADALLALGFNVENQIAEALTALRSMPEPVAWLITDGEECFATNEHGRHLDYPESARTPLIAAPTAGPDERAMASELIKVAAWLLSPEPTRQIDRLEDQTHIGHRQFESAQEAMRETLRLKAIEIKDFADAARASKGTI